MSSRSDAVMIAVMGATGSGKSTFINLISNSALAVGHGLRSCTTTIGLSQTFELSGRSITLIDTPGFDDTIISETDILNMIALYLSTTYQQGFKLSGIVYMHSISDVRFDGILRRNFNMFRKLCGDDVLQNVVIVTNMWEEVSYECGVARETQLANDDLLFKPALAQGARMLRHYNTVPSARFILSSLLSNVPLALRIQRELVDEGKDIADTDAGRALGSELVALLNKHRAELVQVRKELQEMVRECHARTMRELEESRRDLETRIARAECDRERLSRQYEEGKRMFDEKIRGVMNAIEDERRCRVARDQETLRLLHPQEATPSERAWQQRARRESQDPGEECLFSVLGSMLDVVIRFIAVFLSPQNVST
ncbi:hypothetical protein NM688_g1580 [Phlebia brevispora]|uniref:Uncharacterized protein n=1 Tax=Phlebia brevispora TaxID=194682 RepID=A0ACC1TB37_9APHY|nr:hypothetical protein NM688_g1580 [Phlebia brevispora]